MLRSTLRWHCGSHLAFEPPGWAWTQKRVVVGRGEDSPTEVSLTCHLSLLRQMPSLLSSEAEWLAETKNKNISGEYCSFCLILPLESPIFLHPPHVRDSAAEEEQLIPNVPFTATSITTTTGIRLWLPTLSFTPHLPFPCLGHRALSALFHFPAFSMARQPVLGKHWTNQRPYFPAELADEAPFKISQSENIKIKNNLCPQGWSYRIS